MSKFLIILPIFLSTVVVSAATYTITTTVGQETKITRLRTALNTSGQNYVNNEALILDVCGKRIADGIRDVDDQDANAIADRVRGSSQAQRDNACTALGGTVVNGRCQ